MKVAFWIFLFLGFTVPTLGQTPLRVGIPTNQEPHIYLINQTLKGPEGTAMNLALIKAGFTPRYETFPSLRVIERLRKKQIDATINIKEESLAFAFKSQFSYQFQNCAVSKSSSQLRLKNPPTFSGLRVVAFKNARVSLQSGNLQKALENAKSYQEIQDVDARIKLLNSGRVDVLLSDKGVFLFYLEKFKLGSPQSYQIDCLFEPNTYYLFFGKQEDRDQFDRSHKSSSKN